MLIATSRMWPSGSVRDLLSNPNTYRTRLLPQLLTSNSLDRDSDTQRHGKMPALVIVGIAGYGSDPCAIYHREAELHLVERKEKWSRSAAEKEAEAALVATKEGMAEK